MTPITMLNGVTGNALGCACSAPLGAVIDYDVIIIGGKQYSANQIVDSNFVASKPIKLYRGTDFNTPFATIPAGQVIGKVDSYIKATQSTGIRAGGPLISFLDSSGKSYYIKDDNAVSQAALKDQGTLTVAEEVKIEQEKADKENDPVTYYVKKLGMPVLIGGGIIYLVATFGKQYLASKLK